MLLQKIRKNVTRVFPINSTFVRGDNFKHPLKRTTSPTKALRNRLKGLLVSQLDCKLGIKQNIMRYTLAQNVIVNAPFRPPLSFRPLNSVIGHQQQAIQCAMFACSNYCTMFNRDQRNTFKYSTQILNVNRTQVSKLHLCCISINVLFCIL